jgi:hypothetical protein
MGGLVFAHEGLLTPRMPPKLYYALQQQIEELLRNSFNLVHHPIEAPAKTSHGDIDILVATPLSHVLPNRPATGEFLVQLLGAAKCKYMDGTSTYHLVVPWPADHSEPGEASKLDSGFICKTSESPLASSTSAGTSLIHTSNLQLESSSCAKVAPRFVQVDISIMPRPDVFYWNLFFQAHGDLWQMLGGVIRRFGMTVSSKGLYLRIEEVEKHNKEQARVKATDDPNTVLDYMGLDKERYWQPFTSLDDMMDYVASCRFHDPAYWHRKALELDSAVGGEERAETNFEDPEKKKYNPVTKSLKHNDRQRAQKRPAFAYWLNEYLPSHIHAPVGRSSSLTREEVLVDAKEYFGIEFADRFEARKTKWVGLIGVDKLWADVRNGLPLKGREIGVVMRGMKREIAGKEAAGDDHEGLRDARTAFERTNFDRVLQWANKNWEAVAERQRTLEREKSTAHLIEKRRREADLAASTS